MTRQRKQEIANDLVDVRNRVEHLGKKADRPCFDDLDDCELQLFIALFRKGMGCASLARVALLEMTEVKLNAARHAGYSFDLQPFDEKRLSLAELDRLAKLQNRVTAGTEM